MLTLKSWWRLKEKQFSPQEEVVMKWDRTLQAQVSLKLFVMVQTSYTKTVYYSLEFVKGKMYTKDKL